MAAEINEYEIVAPVGVEYQDGSVEGLINCVDDKGVTIRLRARAYILAALADDLKTRFAPDRTIAGKMNAQQIEDYKSMVLWGAPGPISDELPSRERT